VHALLVGIVTWFLGLAGREAKKELERREKAAAAKKAKVLAERAAARRAEADRVRRAREEAVARRVVQLDDNPY
jgi:multidrug efflux pump subunit AcrA (membrane-fusion protein)